MYGSTVTDASLPLIQGFSKLEFIDLRRTGVKYDSAVQLQKDRPRWKVFTP